MNEMGEPRRRRFQFRLRRLLLWTAVVALGCGILSSLEPDALDWVVLPAWFVTVFIVRWGFGGKWAATISIVLGMLLCLGWSIYGSIPTSTVGLAIGCGFVGGSIGLVPFLLVEATCRIVNWIDKIGQSDG